MDITLGCSLADLKSHEAYRQYAAINVENLLYPGYLDQDYRDDLKYLQQECKQRLLLDVPYIDLNLGSPEPRARQLAQEKALAAIEFAQECRAEAIVFLSTFLPFIGLDSYARGWIEESIRSWQALLASKPDVHIALANTFEYTPDNLLEIVRALDHPKLALAFDVGHCLVWGKLAPLEWYRQIRDKCQIVYVHSNNGRADEHRSIRTLRLAEQGVMQELGGELRPDSIVILKYFDHGAVLDDIDYLRGILG